jgi:hypothetical protein
MAKIKRIKPKPPTDMIRVDLPTIEIIDKYVNRDGVARRVIVKKMAELFDQQEEAKKKGV